MVLKSVWQSPGKALEGRDPSANTGDGGTYGEVCPVTAFFKTLKKPENWNKQTKNTKKNVTVASFGWVFLVKSFLVRTAFPFHGDSQAWWGTALGSEGISLFFCILYCLWKRQTHLSLRHSKCQESGFYLAKNLRAVVGKAILLLPIWNGTRQIVALEHNLSLTALAEEKGPTAWGSTTFPQKCCQTQLDPLAWVRLKGCCAWGCCFLAGGVNSYQFGWCSWTPQNQRISSLRELLSIVNRRGNGGIKNWWAMQLRNTFRSPGKPESIFSQASALLLFILEKQAKRNVSTIRSQP